MLGSPGAGKGTQAQKIAIKYNLNQLSTGDLLREEIKNKTEIGKEIEHIISKGDFATDDIVNKLLKKAVINPVFRNHIVFDGYPRNLDQANFLNDLLIKHNQKIDIVFKLSVNLETIKKRISERKTIEKRSDDNEEIAIKRYNTYEKSTEPVIEYYKKLNLLKVIDGERSISQINKEISDIIDLI